MLSQDDQTPEECADDIRNVLASRFEQIADEATKAERERISRHVKIMRDTEVMSEGLRTLGRVMARIEEGK